MFLLFVCYNPCDTNFALIDGFARSLHVSSGVNDKVEPMYAYDLHYVVVKYNAHIIGDNIYNGEYRASSFRKQKNLFVEDVMNHFLLNYHSDKRMNG